MMTSGAILPARPTTNHPARGPQVPASGTAWGRHATRRPSLPANLPGGEVSRPQPSPVVRWASPRPLRSQTRAPLQGTRLLNEEVNMAEREAYVGADRSRMAARELRDKEQQDRGLIPRRPHQEK